jgi:hypothetical protein
MTRGWPLRSRSSSWQWGAAPAPHPAGRLRVLRAHPDVAATIDTEASLPEVLWLRGRVAITGVDGIPPGIRLRGPALPR